MTAMIALLLSLVLAQTDAPRFVVDTVDGPLTAGPLTSLADDFSLTVNNEKVPGKSVVAVRHASLPLPPYPDRNFLWLNNGDRLRLDAGTGCRLNEGRLFFRPAAPLEAK